MAVTGYTGLPGSGKSYSVVEHVILPALKNGRRIFSNIPLNMDLINQEFGGLVTLFETKDLEENPDWFQDVFEAGATLVLDEAWRVWPAGMKANNINEAHKSFLAEHRHMVGEDGNSTEIVLVTQDLAQIASYPRSLVESTYRTVKLVAVGANNRFRVDIYQGPATGPNPPEKNRVRQIHGQKYQDKIYRYYKSQTLSETDGHGDESRTDTRTNILNTPYFKFGIPAALVSAVLVVWLGLKAVSGFFGIDQEEQLTETDTIAVTQEQAGPDLRQEVPKVAEIYPHFYQGMNAYIAFNMGRSPWVDYKIAFVSGDQFTVLDEDQLSRLGYWVKGIDQCFVQIIGHGDTLNVYCEEAPDQKPATSSIIEL